LRGSQVCWELPKKLLDDGNCCSCDEKIYLENNSLGGME